MREGSMAAGGLRAQAPGHQSAGLARREGGR